MRKDMAILIRFIIVFAEISRIQRPAKSFVILTHPGKIEY